jgi:uncharacterized alkaline shock family protein YloU
MATCTKDLGIVEISDEVIAAIAGLATLKVKGVFSMSGGVVDGITDVIGKKSLTKGIKVKSEEENVTIDANIIVNYGDNIPEVSENIQKQIKEDVEEYTGLSAIGVNIHVLGINRPEKSGDETIDVTADDIIQP